MKKILIISTGGTFNKIYDPLLGTLIVDASSKAVETIAQKQLLETLFIDAIQGYLIARPSPLTQGLQESNSIPS